MKKRDMLFGTFIFLFVFVALSSAQTINVDDDNATLTANFSTIQGAINFAASGDVIDVAAGAYTENLAINKGVSIIGNGTATTDLTGTHTITANNVIIKNFNLVTTSTTIIIDSSSSSLSNIQIKDNVFGLTTSPAVGIAMTGSNTISNIEINDNIFNGPTDKVCNPWKIGGSFGSPESVEVSGLDFLRNKVNKCSTPVNLQNKNLNDFLISENVYRNTDGAMYIWTEDGSSPSGVLSNFSFSKNDVDSSNTYGLAFFDTDLNGNTFVDSNFGSGIVIGYNYFSNIPGGYGLKGVSLLASVSTFTLDAENNWWGNCNGPTHTSNPSGTGSGVSDAVDFTPWAGVCITDKINPICVFKSKNITLNATVNSLDSILNVSNIWFSYNINGINYNKTATTNGEFSILNINSSELVGGQSITWTVYANDTEGFLFKNGLETFYVRNDTKLSVSPSVPDGNNSWYITEPQFSLVRDTNALGNIFYQWDSDDIFLYSSPFKLESIPNQPNVTAGILDLNYWSGFTCGNETHQEQIFKVDLTNPVIDETPADNSIVYNNQKPNISAYISEVYGSNSGINLSTINMEVDGIVVTPTNISSNGLDALVWFVPASDLSVGNHTVMVNVTDNAGRYSFKEWTFTIALTPALSLTIHSPQNQTYDTRRISVNVSLNGTVELLQYINYMDNNPRYRNLCKECNSSGFYKEKEITFREGENILGVRATDFFGAVNEENVTFFIDSKLPKIARTEPTRNSFTNGSNFYIKYTEENVAELLLSLNSTLNLTSQCNSGGKNQECFFNVNLSAYDGTEVSYQFNMTDVAGNKGNSKLIPVKVDTTDPVVNLFNYSIDGKRVEFTLNVDEINFEEINYIDSSDNNPREKRLCSSLKNNSCKKKVSFSSGNHSIDIIVRDKAGNTAVVENVLINIA